MAELWIDHVVYVVDDLERGAAEFIDRFGLSAMGGGRHPGWGTANRIVPLGREYIELVAVVDRDEADTSEFGRAVMTAGAAGRRLAGWAAATGDLDGVARRLDLEITRGARTRATTTLPFDSPTGRHRYRRSPSPPRPVSCGCYRSVAAACSAPMPRRQAASRSAPGR